MSSYETFVYADFVFAVGLLVVIPLFLLFASVNLPSVRDRLLVYWRASALLGITVYLWIGEETMGFATGFAARALIPLALWRGDAFMVLRGRSVPAIRGWRASLYRYWREAAIAYNVMGLVYMLPLLPCVVQGAGPLCEFWYAPPQQYADWLHPTVERVWLGRYGWVALGVYSAYLLSTAMRLQRDLLERRTSNV
jgi:hypothetical protein